MNTALERMTKRKPEQPAEKTPRKGRQLSLWVNKDLAQAFEDFMDSLRPRGILTAHLEIALEEYLKDKGFWPPQAKG